VNLYDIYADMPTLSENWNPNDYAKRDSYQEKYDAKCPMMEWIAKNYEFETLKDICEHGMVSGFGSLVYYKDTCEFYDKFSDQIWELLSDFSSDQGLTEMQFIATLNGQLNVGSDATFKNLLCWFAAEECARKFVDTENENFDD
jgi:hypothetical protein